MQLFSRLLLFAQVTKRTAWRIGSVSWTRSLCRRPTFGELPQIRALVDVLVPLWFQKSVLPLRVWSAASATGEEPYSILIALAEAGWLNHPIEIHASDSSRSALERARRGISAKNRSAPCQPSCARSTFPRARAAGNLTPSWRGGSIFNGPTSWPAMKSPNWRDARSSFAVMYSFTSRRTRFGARLRLWPRACR